VLGLRYGGKAGKAGSYRVYAKFRRDEGQPFTTGVDSDETLKSGQAGVRFDFGPSSPTSITLQSDVYTGNTDLSSGSTSPGQIDFAGGNALGRVRHTYRSGAQIEFQGYYDGTYRKVPGQYAERRNTMEVELQYRWSAARRHDLTAGLGTLLTRDHVTPGGSLFFDPASRTITRVNFFAQDAISLPGRVVAILGTKLERNTYSGFEYQPNARLKWNVGRGQVLWGGISRGVRVPSRFDTDLRFTATTPIVVLTGNPEFQSETAISREAGYRTYVIPKLALGINGFVNSYDELRTQEPTPPLGVPIVLANKQAGRVSGVEIAGHYEPWEAWQLWGGYAYLHERFEFDADSRDQTGGSLEHNDPSHRVWLRSYSDLPKKFAFDATFRWVGALPRPVVPAYGELTIRVARPLNRSVELEVIGDNLLHDRHLEFANLGPAHEVPRSIFARLTWRSR
jgi:iron complex outermembrane recepter protein